MKQAKNIYVQLTENYLAFISNLSREEIDKLEKKEMTINFVIAPDNKKSWTNYKLRELPAPSQIDVNSIIRSLYQMDNRAGGERYLTAKCTNRTELEIVARKLDIPFQKKDSIEKLKNKIIERTIGFRLRSQAIHG